MAFVRNSGVAVVCKDQCLLENSTCIGYIAENNHRCQIISKADAPAGIDRDRVAETGSEYNCWRKSFYWQTEPQKYCLSDLDLTFSLFVPESCSRDEQIS